MLGLGYKVMENDKAIVVMELPLWGRKMSI